MPDTITIDVTPPPPVLVTVEVTPPATTEVETQVTNRAITLDLTTQPQSVNLDIQPPRSITVSAVYPAGPPGPAGPAGADGAQGVDGAPGTDGVGLPWIVIAEADYAALATPDSGTIYDVILEGETP